MEVEDLLEKVLPHLGKPHLQIWPSLRHFPIVASQMVRGPHHNCHKVIRPLHTHLHHYRLLGSPHKGPLRRCLLYLSQEEGPLHQSNLSFMTLDWGPWKTRQSQPLGNQ